MTDIHYLVRNCKGKVFWFDLNNLNNLNSLAGFDDFVHFYKMADLSNFHGSADLSRH
jgi:hypothetical protein